MPQLRPSQIMVAAPGISNSAIALREALTGSRNYARPGNVTVTNRRHTLINWGCASPDRLRAATGSLTPHHTLNRPRAVVRASGKLSCLRALQQAGLPIPEFTTNRGEAQRWVRDGGVAYARTVLNGHSAEGIVVERDPAAITQAPLYTKGMDKRHEFRVHVFAGQVIDVTRKAFRPEVPRESRNRDIMNHSTGTVFIRTGDALRNIPQAILDDSIAAVRACGLDFGGVDIMTERNTGRHEILEINTACGLEGTTLERYSRAIVQYMDPDSTVEPWDPAEFERNNPTQSENTGSNDMSQVIIQGQTITAGSQVVYTGTATSLRNGSAYPVERVGNGRIYILNLNGEIRPYSSGNFRVNIPATPTRLTVTPPPEGLCVRTDVPATDPQRFGAVGDGSMVNPGGSIEMNASVSSAISRGTRVTVVGLYRGSRTNNLIIDVNLPNGGTSKYRAEHFINAQPNLDVNVTPTPASASPANPRPTVVNAHNGTAIQRGSHVRVISAQGGHGLMVGTLATVGSVDVSSGNVTLRAHGAQGDVRIRASRLDALTTENYQALLAELELATRNRNATFDVVVDGSTIRIAASQRQSVMDTLRRASV